MFEQHQVAQLIVDRDRALVAALVAGDDFDKADDLHAVHDATWSVFAPARTITRSKASHLIERKQIRPKEMFKRDFQFETGQC